MVAFLGSAEDSPELQELLRPEKLQDGTEPEQRIILCDISWERYLALDKALGDDRPSPRFYFFENSLEVMTTSNEHERVRKWLSGLMDLYFDHAGIDPIPRGQATLRLAKAVGAEPDESWCIGGEKEMPDIVLEVALTSGGINKLRIYKQFQIPEVWIWRRDRLELHVFESAGNYQLAASSRIVPHLSIPLLERCVRIASYAEARREFRAGLV